MTPQTPTTAQRRRPLRIALIALIVLLAVAIGGRFALALGPMSVAQRFCDATIKGDYQQVYAQMSGTLRQHTPIAAADYVAAEQLADQQAGRVTGCDIVPWRVDVGFGSGTVHLIEHRASGTVAVELHTAGDQIAVFPDNAVYSVNTALSYCVAIKAQNYPDAYRLLAPAITNALVLDRYMTAAQLFDKTGGNVSDCAIATLLLNSEQSVATLGMIIHRQGSSDASSAVTLTIGRQKDGTWLIMKLPSA